MVHPDRDVRLLVRGEDTGGRLAMLEIVAPRGDGPPRHIHHWEDEIVSVLAGTVTFRKGEQRLDGPTGTSILLPHGIEHAWRVESAVARLLVAIAPAGLEAWYGELSSRETPIERLIALAARCGIEVTGPHLAP